MVNDGKTKSSKVKLEGKEPVEPNEDLVKPKKDFLKDGDDEGNVKSVLDTPYIIKGDGQITIKVMTPAKRDAEIEKRKKNSEGKVSLTESSDEEKDGLAKK